MSPRPFLPESSLRPEVRQTMAAFHADVVAEVAAAVTRERVVLVGMAQNPFVRRARALLQRELAPTSLRFTELSYGSYFAQWKRRLAIKLWSGWPTFPQIFIDGILVGGYLDLQRAIASGDFARWMSTPGSVREK